MAGIDRRGVLAGSGAALAAVSVSAVAAETPAAQSLKGRSVLITGTSSGFGRLGALLYARLGAKVFATMRGLPRREAEELRALASDEKLDITILPLDVRDEAQVNAAVAEAERMAGGALDIVVNNAGVVINGPVEVHDLAAAQLQFDTNVLGFHRVARAVLPAMRARKAGLIFNVSSQQGRIIMPGFGLYAATKFAVEAWAEQLAYEVAGHGIEVCIIQPGGYPTAVGTNRARYAKEIRDRAPARHTDGYPAIVASMGAPPPSPAPGAAPPPNMPDPLDVPRAIAEIAAMPPGTRPLRRAVHPGNKPQLEINRVSAETQRTLLSRGPYAAIAQGVLD